MEVGGKNQDLSEKNARQKTPKNEIRHHYDCTLAFIPILLLINMTMSINILLIITKIIIVIMLIINKIIIVMMA